MQSPSLEGFNRIGRTSLQMLLAFGCCLALFASLALISAPKHASAHPASIRSTPTMHLYAIPPTSKNIVSLYISVDKNSTNTNPQWCTNGTLSGSPLDVGVVARQSNGDWNISVEGSSGQNCQGTLYGPLPWVNFNWNSTTHSCTADFPKGVIDGPGCTATSTTNFS